MIINIGDYVRIPSGDIFQVEEVIARWKRKIPLDGGGRVSPRLDLILNEKGFRGRTLRIAEYQCSYVQGMATCGG
ncbi:hypothetical protein FEZ51_02000 [Pediococcus stilesii]|uniref:Uncharacterized protein n=1 Tax=Pediococcus stilesii TaxID=331679 RepID=A0A5R9BXL9_9LACO|nr:hypothetical protein [Pediococcus stilesii]TLQ05456.1 hypothetical protein FEZ51_02000 [Pediococcus stilesii]